MPLDNSACFRLDRLDRLPAPPLAVAALPGLRQSFVLLDGGPGAGKLLFTADLFSLRNVLLPGKPTP